LFVNRLLFSEPGATAKTTLHKRSKSGAGSWSKCSRSAGTNGLRSLPASYPMNKSDKRQFYFSLLRAIAMLRGGDARRTESNGFEAWLVGLTIYSIHYLFFATRFIPSNLEPWLTALLFVALAFWIWLFWLLLIYINSVITKVLHVCGLFRAIPTRRVQSILWGISTTAMACALLKSSPSLRELGALWLVAVAMNLASALVLAFRDAARRPAE
jgi:hypothetical protein